MFDGDKAELKGNVELCGDCEWPWVNLWMYLERGQIPGAERFNIDDFRGKSIDELNRELAESLDNAVNAAREFENSKDQRFLEEISSMRSKIEAINQALNEAYYNNVDNEERKKRYEERIDILRGILEKYGEIDSYVSKEVRYEIPLVVDNFERVDSWCMVKQEYQCKLEEGCWQGGCIYALGGEEDCSNGADDDSDNIVDCDDPDCAKECGRLCEPVCSGSGKCWEETGKRCEGVCKECWNCHSEDCGSVCEGECSTCTNSVELKEICQDCRICEDEAYGSGCFEECEDCQSCEAEAEIVGITEGGYCSERCVSCRDCERSGELEGCKAQCNGDVTCESACVPDEGVKAECQDGFSDCDGDGDCETRGGCTGEICDDNKDNDGNDFIDCEEVSCEGSLCAFSQERISVCLEHSCVPEIKFLEKPEGGIEGPGEVEEPLGIDEREASQVEEREEEKPKEGPECMIVEDCGDNEVCSRGLCTELEFEEEQSSLPSEPPEEKPTEQESEPLGEGDPIDVSGDSFLEWVTGLFAEEENRVYCEEKGDCSQNQDCDTFRNECHCLPGFADCNEDLGDGCESDDITCGGKFEICPGGCHETQYCKEEYGWCECKEGLNDCDGNWQNGCESEAECRGCSEDSDCSAPICEVHGGNRVFEFGCFKGNNRTEERGAIKLAGGCNYNPVRKVDAYVNFDAWGSFEEINAMRKEDDRRWCEFELENLVRERREIEDSLNGDTLTWFFVI